jgi:hypothetical protein
MDHSRHPLPMLAPPPLAYDLLIAGMAVGQASTTTAALAERLAQPEAYGDMCSALVSIFGGEDDRAAGMLRGSFHPLVARKAGKVPSMLVKTGLTLAF